MVCSSAGSAGGSAGGGSTGGGGGGSNVRPLRSTFSQSDSGVIPIPTPFFLDALMAAKLPYSISAC